MLIEIQQRHTFDFISILSNEYFAERFNTVKRWASVTRLKFQGLGQQTVLQSNFKRSTETFLRFNPLFFLSLILKTVLVEVCSKLYDVFVSLRRRVVYLVGQSFCDLSAKKSQIGLMQINFLANICFINRNFHENQSKFEANSSVEGNIFAKGGERLKNAIVGFHLSTEHARNPCNKIIKSKYFLAFRLQHWLMSV